MKPCRLVELSLKILLSMVSWPQITLILKANILRTVYYGFISKGRILKFVLIGMVCVIKACCLMIKRLAACLPIRSSCLKNSSWRYLTYSFFTPSNISEFHKRSRAVLLSHLLRLPSWVYLASTLSLIATWFWVPQICVEFSPQSLCVTMAQLICSVDWDRRVGKSSLFTNTSASFIRNIASFVHPGISRLILRHSSLIGAVSFNWLRLSDFIHRTCVSLKVLLTLLPLKLLVELMAAMMILSAANLEREVKVVHVPWRLYLTLNMTHPNSWMILFLRSHTAISNLSSYQLL